MRDVAHEVERGPVWIDGRSLSEIEEELEREIQAMEEELAAEALLGEEYDKQYCEEKLREIAMRGSVKDPEEFADVEECLERYQTPYNPVVEEVLRKEAPRMARECREAAEADAETCEFYWACYSSKRIVMHLDRRTIEILEAYVRGCRAEGLVPGMDEVVDEPWYV